MERDRDIYGQKPAPPPEKREYPEVDVTPRAVRMAFMRRTLVFVLFVALVLALASWIAFLLEERRQRDDVEEMALPPRTEDAREPRTPAVAMPDMPAALEHLDTMEEDAPADMDPAKITEAMGHIRIAQQYLQVEDLERAEIAARRALEIWSDMHAAQSALAFIHTQRGQFDEAISYLNAALRSDPFSADNYNTLAAVYIQKGEMERAEELLHTALQIRPEYVQARINFGMLHLLNGRYELAADYFEQALQEMPEHTGIRNNLAVCLLRTGRYQEARTHFKHLIETVPDVPAWYFDMAILYTEQAEFDDAMVWVRRGADYCTPVEFQRFMEDTSFSELREQPAYQEFKEAAFPEIPAPLGG